MSASEEVLSAKNGLTCPRSDADKPSMKRLSPTVERLAAGVTLAVAFILMASVFAPNRTRAQEEWPAAGFGYAASIDPHAGLASLGVIEGDQYIVRIFAAEPEPLFSVYSAADRRELGVLLTAVQVTGRFPDLPLSEMDYGTGESIMLADPDAGGFAR